MSRYIVICFTLASLIVIGHFVEAHNSTTEKPAQPLRDEYSRRSSIGTHAVKCYTCVNCPKTTNDTSWKHCPRKYGYNNNKCVTYSEKYFSTHGKSITWVIRGCASQEGSCEEIKQAYRSNNPNVVQLEYCNECDGDRCNGVSRSLPDLFFAFIAIVLAPTVAKLTLS